MLCFIIVISISLFQSSHARIKENYNGKPIVCSDPEAIRAGNQFFTCFDLNVQNIIKNENKSCPLLDSAVEYVYTANETCYKDTISPERDIVEFGHLWRFGMKSAFKDFVDLGGVECIKAIRNRIVQCVSDTIGTVRGVNNKYHVMWKAASLDYDEKSCRDTKRIKNCTLSAMRTEGYYKCRYDTSLVLYVGSLFDYMLERCTRIVPKWEESACYSEQAGAIGSRTTHILLGLLLMLALFGILFVTFRYCRNNGGRFTGWKLFI